RAAGPGDTVTGGRGITASRLLLLGLLALVPYLLLPGKPALLEGYRVIASASPLASAPLAELAVSDPWGTSFDAEGASPIYRPLVTLSWALQVRATGPSPRALHLVDMLLHAACVVLVALLLAAFLREARWALTAAALFAVHPLASEAVCSVVGRADLLAASFLTGALLLRARAPAAALPWAAHAGAVVLIAAAIFSSEYALAFPFLLAFFDLARAHAARRPIGRPDLLVWVAAAAVAVLYLAVRSVLVGSLLAIPELASADDPLANASFSSRIGTASWLIVTALRLVLLPIGLSHEYGRGTVTVASGLADLRALAGVSVLAVSILVAGRILVRRRDPSPAIALSLFAVPLAFVIAAYALFGAPFAERHLYVPAIGLAVAVCWLLSRLAPSGERANWVKIVVVLVVASGMGLTVSRVDAWRSTESLTRSALRTYPGSSVLWRELGIIELARGAPESAAESLERAVAAFDADPRAWRMLGAASMQLERHAAAARAMRRTIELTDGKDAATWRALGRAELASRRFSAALTALSKARDLDPADPEGRTELAQALLRVAQSELREGRNDEAVRRAREALLVTALPAQGRFLAGLVLARAGVAKEARAAFDAALREDPDLLARRFASARTAEDEGRFDVAIEAYEEILLARPEQVPTLFSLGRAYLLAARPADAIGPLARGIEIQDDERARTLLEEARRRARAGESR
ncbi:MAG: tetratricopeptide repeat protein, partial [Acidobacteriota bacterium]|nr:tetratricopeptide repeat protein [Acidobacteriota bacterium]